jgi:hypothetical protein
VQAVTLCVSVGVEQLNMRGAALDLWWAAWAWGVHALGTPLRLPTRPVLGFCLLLHCVGCQ